MATKFLEPGGDADFLTSAGTGFWDVKTNTPAVATDFVNGAHIKSIKYTAGSADNLTKKSVVQDAGARISFYIFLNALPNATAKIMSITDTSSSDQSSIRLTSAGVLQIFNNTVQIGTNGSTLSTGTWYRISFAYTVTSTSVNEFRLFKNGVIDITITNATLTITTGVWFVIGNILGTNIMDLRSSDHYIDNSSALTDPGTTAGLMVTAKRPIANGTTNGFTTQIGAGGSGVGTGHSPQVNERPLSNTNGWSMVGAGSAVTEEYNIEGKSAGDIDISTATIVDWLGWADIKSLAGETVQIILNGANTAQAITSTETLYTAIKGSATYPAGTGADIGVITDTSLTTVSLYECGVVVAYIPAVATSTFLPRRMKMGVGL